MTLESAFARARREGRRALMPFLVAGFPSMEGFREQLRAAAEFADVIEVGVPFSDPLADGPVIQEAASQALRAGTTLDKVLAELAGFDGPPIVLMISINQVLAAGAESFARRCAESGVSGIIVPDLPHEESAELREVCARHGLHLIAMVAPSTDAARLDSILETATGFLYLIAVAGVTGAREGVAPETLEYLGRIRRRVAAGGIPLCVGFGISGPEQIETLRDLADGFIVGSALVKRIAAGQPIAGLLNQMRQAARTLEGAK